MLLNRVRLVWYYAAMFLSVAVEPVCGQFTTMINVPPLMAPASIGSDTQLNLSAGGAVGDSFNAGLSNGTGSNVEMNILGGYVGLYLDAYSGATINVFGGYIDERFTAHAGSEVNVSGGNVGPVFRALNGSKVNIAGGQVDTPFIAFGGSTINVSGGSVGPDSEALAGSAVHISGGLVGHRFETFGRMTISGGTVASSFGAFVGSDVNISGGSIGDGFRAGYGAKVNLSGIQFVLDGTDITASLLATVPLLINDRDVSLSGMLADGSPFNFDLNSTSQTGQDYFASDALLTVTLVQPGDFNGDLNVDGRDFLKWQRGMSPNPGGSTDLLAWESNYSDQPGDFDGDGVVSGLDFLKWQRGESPSPWSQSDLATWEAKYDSMVAGLQGPAVAVPEPASLLLFATLGAGLVVILSQSR